MFSTSSKGSGRGSQKKNTPVVRKSTTHTPIVKKSTTHTPIAKKSTTHTPGVKKSTTHTPTVTKSTTHTPNNVKKSTTHTPNVKKSTTHTPTVKKSTTHTPKRTSTQNSEKKAPPARASSEKVLKSTTHTPKSSENRPNTQGVIKSTTHQPKKATSTRSLDVNHSSTTRASAKNDSTRSSSLKRDPSQRSQKSHHSASQRSTSSHRSGRPSSRKRAPSARSRLTPGEQHLQDLLGEGAYHLPNNTCCQDWMQVWANTHPLFSICFQHRLHPISKGMKAVQLLGSIMVGLVITNIIYLLVIHDKQELVKLPTGDLAIANGTDTWTIVEPENESEVLREYTELQLDTGMIVLWTVGSAIHAIWDNTIWYATACACCHSDKRWVDTAKRICNFAVIVGVVALSALATLAVIIRAHVEGGGEVEVSTLRGRGIEAETISSTDNYEFLLSYAVELALAWLLWFPIIETILFSGVLGCCCYRFRCCNSCWYKALGGRPAEVRLEQEEMDLEQPKLKDAGSVKSRR